MFKVGQNVRVVSSGGCYSTYPVFFKNNGLEEYEKFYKFAGEIIPGEYVIVAIGKNHEDYKVTGCLYLLQNKSGQIFIMGNQYGDIKPIPPTLTTGQMIDAIQPEQRYKCSVDAGGKYDFVSIVNNRICWGGDYSFPLYIVLGEGSLTWTFVPPEPTPVGFMEAVKAYSEGKTIWCNSTYGIRIYTKGTSYSLHDDKGGIVTSIEILEGKWFIKED